MRISKTLAATACTVAALSLTACGSTGTSSSGDTMGSDSSSASGDSSSMAADPAADLVGPGCAAYAKAVPDGAGSVEGMAKDKVPTAASNNPLLKTLVAAVSGKLNKKVNLVDTLNNGEYTVFAPVDDAFAKLPKKTVKALSKPKNATLLTDILTYHVISGQLSPADVVGSQKTVEGKAVKVTGSGDTLQVNGAKVICGGVKTANATVYLIDTVLTPPAK